LNIKPTRARVGFFLGSRMIALAQLLFSAAVAASPPSAPTSLVTEDCEFGEAYAFNHAECQMELRNQGEKPIRVSEFKSNKPNDAMEPGELLLAPHAHAYLKANLGIGNETGHVRHVFVFRSDEPGHENRVITARGYVMTVLDDRPLLDFGVVDVTHESQTKNVELSSHDTAGFRIEKILSVPDWLEVKLASDGHGLAAKVRADAQWGFHVDQVKLSTNSQLQKEVWVGVQADIHGTVVPASNPLDMGLLRTGNRNEQKIRLTSTTGKDFTIGKVELEGLKGEAKPQLCVPPVAGCRMVQLTIADDQPLGSVKGKLWVDLPEFHQRLPIALWGMLVAKETQIEKVEAAKLLEEKRKRDATSVAPNYDVNLNTAIKSVVQAANEADPPGKGPLLKWSVANEQLVHGYQIFRADLDTGPFLLLNKSSIPARRDASGSVYQWRDNSATSGKTYWYYIGILYNDGHKQQLTGPQKVVAK
jgi:hypothetical protein